MKSARRRRRVTDMISPTSAYDAETARKCLDPLIFQGDEIAKEIHVLENITNSQRHGTLGTKSKRRKKHLGHSKQLQDSLDTRAGAENHQIERNQALQTYKPIVERVSLTPTQETARLSRRRLRALPGATQSSCDAVSKCFIVLVLLLGAISIDKWIQQYTTVHSEPVREWERDGLVAQYSGLELAALDPNQSGEMILLPGIVSRL